MGDGVYAVEVVGGVSVVAAPEEIDSTNVSLLRSAMAEAAAQGTGTLVVDMTLTQFCDSSGLHTLLATRKRAQADGGDLLVVLAAATVRRIFALTGVDRLIPSFSSLDDALATGARRGAGQPQARA